VAHRVSGREARCAEAARRQEWERPWQQKQCHDHRIPGIQGGTLKSPHFVPHDGCAARAQGGICSSRAIAYCIHAATLQAGSQTSPAHGSRECDERRVNEHARYLRSPEGDLYATGIRGATVHRQYSYFVLWYRSNRTKTAWVTALQASGAHHATVQLQSIGSRIRFRYGFHPCTEAQRP
jgi:hypothetical protein